jgi:hypothetical protein
MATNIPVSTLITIRDNLVTAYTAISESPTKMYTLGDRTFQYEDRDDLWKEIQTLNREILLRSTGNGANARGHNRMDFRKWD